MAELRSAKGLSPRVLDPLSEHTLTTYPWPGNVREPHHALERACILAPQSPLTPELLFGSDAPDLACAPDADEPERLADYLAKCERAYIQSMLNQGEWRITETAARLGIAREGMPEPEA